MGMEQAVGPTAETDTGYFLKLFELAQAGLAQCL
jgi:hypothetical protein